MSGRQKVKLSQNQDLKLAAVDSFFSCKHGNRFRKSNVIDHWIHTSVQSNGPNVEKN